MKNLDETATALSRFAQKSKPTVTLLVYEGIGPFHLSGPLLVFGKQGVYAPLAELVLCASAPGLIRTAAGFDISAPHGLNMIEQNDIVIIPGWNDIDEPVPQALKDALQQAYARGAQIVGLCLGVFVLAEAGLLNGKRATTHWSQSGIFAKRFPSVRLDPDILYARDGNIWTSAGGAAAIDACLLLLSDQCGSAIADVAARRLVTSPLRYGEQQQIIQRPLAASDEDRDLPQLLERVKTNLHEAHKIDMLAASIKISVRTFTRRFRQITGTTFLQWLLAQRLAYVQQLLESSNHTVESIVTEAGFGSALSLRKHFRRAFGVTPTEYRKKWRDLRMV